MVIVKILGGLGNQLFQYAAARALADQRHTEVKLDISSFKDDTLRGFDLSQFNFNYGLAGADEIKKYKATTSFERLSQRIVPYKKRYFYKQPAFSFDPKFFSLNGNIYLQGYFQSEKYFSSIAPTIYNEAVLKEGLSEEVLQLAKELINCTSVAIHIRRGDYKNMVALSVHGILPMSYYNEATDYIKQRTEETRFFVFTDDPAMDMSAFTSSNVTLVSGIFTKNSLEDFFLMSRCRHAIIANSSFSWWAAWLNRYSEKIIIAPKKWFSNGPKDTQDLLPENWIQL